MKVERIGTVWTANAKLYNANGKLIAYCIDTPNGIAKALMECKNTQTIKCIDGLKTRNDYKSRMQSWNIANSNIKYI